MKRKRSFVRPVLIFVLAQVAWVSLVALWIYWYVSNYIVLTEVGNRLSVQFKFAVFNVAPLVGGLVLLVGISFALSLIFRRLSVHFNLTQSYDTFIANITHELKSPLASIQLYLDTLQSRRVPEDKRREFYAIMVKDAARLKRLIDSILEISGIEEQKASFHYELHQADELMRTTIDEVIEQLKLPESAVRITGKADCRCVVSPDALQTVFANLFDNAAKYSVGSVSIEVRLECDGKRLRFEVSDNGIGIGSKEQKRVFGKFQRIENPNSPDVTGTGLGLYLVKEIVKQHNGEISVYSEGWNKGTTFTVELPAYSKAPGNRARELLDRQTEYSKRGAVDE